MLEIRRYRMLTPVTVAVASCIGCATVSPSALEPIPEPLTEVEVRAIATLLEIEDRRDFDAVLVTRSAGAEQGAVRARTALAAARIGSPAGRPFVGTLLEDEDTAVVVAAAFSAGQLRDTAAVASLAELLRAERAVLNPTIAGEAAAALGRIGTPEALEAIRRFLASAVSDRSMPTTVVHHALIAAWRAGETETGPFAPWLDHAEPELRWAAAYGLSRRPRPESVPLLLPALRDSDPRVRAHALRGLTAAQVDASESSREDVLLSILEAVGDTAYIVRIDAIRTLGSFDDAAAVGALVEILEGSDRHGSVAALESLGRIGPAAIAAGAPLRTIVEELRTPTFIRESAIDALARIAPADALPLLAGLASDPHWRVRAAVARSLGMLGGGAIPGLEALVRDSDPRVSTTALRQLVTTLGDTAIHTARPLLLESIRASDPHIRAAALEGLGILADPVVFPALLDAYDVSQRDAANEAAIAAIDAIVALRSSSLVPERAFFARFSPPLDDRVRRHAAAAFGDSAPTAWRDPPFTPAFTSPAGYHRFIDAWLAPSPPDRDLPIVRIETEIGPIDLLLYGDDAPMTTANFLRLARTGFFDGQEWPRVVPNFVVQGGDPRGDTSGGPGYTIRDELNRRRYGTGTLGMALSGPDTGGSQFFITHSPQPHLDGTYTVFGRVLDGDDILRMILPGERILSVRQIGGRDVDEE